VRKLKPKLHYGRDVNQAGPKASGYAVDVAIAQAAYASSRDGCAIDLMSPPWAIGHEQ